MTKMEYAKKVAELIDGVVVEKKKNNGVIYTGVTVEKAGVVTPIMYIDEFYENGTDVEEVVERFKEELKKVDEFDVNVNVLDSFENAKSSISVKLVNKKNADEEFVYKSAEEYGYDDLILIPTVEINIPDGKGAVKIKHEMLEDWGVTTEDVINVGIENVDCVVESLSKRLSKITGMPEETFGGEENPLVFVSTNDGICGASAIIKAKEELEKRFPNGYVVIPSSIHEMLVVPYDADNDKDLNGLVNEVNTTVLSAEDYLSDNVYKFVA